MPHQGTLVPDGPHQMLLSLICYKNIRKYTCVAFRSQTCNSKSAFFKDQIYSSFLDGIEYGVIQFPTMAIPE